MHQACNMPPGPMIIPCDPDSTGIIGRALAERRTLFRTGDLRVPLGHVQLRSAIATPIVLKGNLVGAFVMANRPDGYGPDQVRQLERIAAQTAPVLQAKLESERQECQRRELERRLRQAQKMEAIGTLAGGIAHDFNNILSGVLGYAELALDDLADRPRTQNRVQQVIRAALRAQDVVRQILTFSRQTEQTRSPVRLQSVVKEVARLLRSSLPASISLHMSLPPELEPVLADPAQIHQVLMNLATNAYQSMRPLAEAPAEARRDCILRIGLERAEVDAGNPEGHRLGLPPGSYAVLSVRDTGDGIPPHIRDRIFEPYFTTRQKENGTGLGLATVQGIAQAHGGAVTFETRIGEGTAFRVFLPMAAPDAIARDEGTAQARPPHAGCEQILLVDDEHMILEVQQQSLELRGYRALAYGDPVQALDAFTQSPREIDLVVTDLTMPHMNGLELTKQLRQHRPDLPVILCTGFGDATTERTAEQLGIDLLLRKPLLTSELADAIRHALDKRHHRGHDAPS
jgi:signal transduction histidine kinase/ActR/RegA family two-component response regulator